MTAANWIVWSTDYSHGDKSPRPWMGGVFADYDAALRHVRKEAEDRRNHGGYSFVTADQVMMSSPVADVVPVVLHHVLMVLRISSSGQSAPEVRHVWQIDRWRTDGSQNSR